MSLESEREVIAHRIAEPASWRSVPVLDSGREGVRVYLAVERWLLAWDRPGRGVGDVHGDRLLHVMP